MKLMDHFFERLAERAEVESQSCDYLEILKISPRFVVNQKASKEIKDFTNGPMQAAPADFGSRIFLPTDKFWFEGNFDELQVGGLITKNSAFKTSSLEFERLGSGFFALRYARNGEIFPFATPLDFRRSDGTWMLDPIFPFDIELEDPGIFVEIAVKFFFTGFLYKINGPRFYIKRGPDAKVLNRRRVSKRRFPLLSFSEVKIDFSAAETVVTPPTGHGVPKALHHVRAHLRRYKSGRIVQVQAHWRGDAKLGVKHPHYSVTDSSQ